MISHGLGFPRIGSKREFKFALEAYWSGKIDLATMQARLADIQRQNWLLQAERGLDYVPVGDFAMYDHVLDMSMMLGNVPDRFDTTDSEIDRMFLMARGRAPSGKPVAASEMTKWFNTNYHYIVPEFSAKRKLSVNPELIVSQIKAAQECSVNAKPVIVGPATYLYLAKFEDGSAADYADAVAECYKTLLAAIEATGVEWIQIDEPIFALDLEPKWLTIAKRIYAKLEQRSAKRLLATYFESVEPRLGEILELPIDGLHVDLVTAPGQLDAVLSAVKGTDLILSAGVVSGRDVWRTNLERAHETLAAITEALGEERVWLAASCSLMFSPLDLNLELTINDEIKSWLAFAYQKLDELRLLKQAASNGGGVTAEIVDYTRPYHQRMKSERTNDKEVSAAMAAVTSDLTNRTSPYAARYEKQSAKLGLPLFPTTSVGSFPQTAAIRKLRREFKQNIVSEDEYRSRMQDEIKSNIKKQDEYGLDVYVHGEPERNDMVEYFGEQLQGFAATKFGWVQSYGSRCVKPPIIYGDIKRTKPMTLDWLTYSQSLTDKPVKGMLTGPVTMLAWSFRRDDITFDAMCTQMALALRGEVLDLEQAGIKIIQIDEPAFREAMPLAESKQDGYFKSAVKCFRISAAGVRDETQIQSHMCYSAFNHSMEYVAEMDMDVLLIEASRSGMKIFKTFQEFNYPNSIGIGVYDIHSPNIPTTEGIARLLKDAASLVDKKQLWVTPDCGLKTRNWEQVDQALTNMQSAALGVR